MNKKQIQGMASKPEYALIRPSADELTAISDEVIQYSCACKWRYIKMYDLFLIRHRLNWNGIDLKGIESRRNLKFVFHVHIKIKYVCNILQL